MIITPPIKTQRLLLQRPTMDDFDRFFAMSKDPEVMRYIGDGSIFHWTREIARDKFKQKLTDPDNGPIDTVAVYRQVDWLYLGWCAISPSKFLNATALEYHFSRDAWGLGYATEAAAALLSQADQVMDLNCIMACAHPDNQASLGVLKKLAFSHVTSKPSKPAGTDLLVYQLYRHAFATSGWALSQG